MSSWISVVIAFITLIVTICIPIQIMKFQRYTALTSIYMSFEFAHAFQSVIEFFHNECGCDVNRIPEVYKRRFMEDWKKWKEGKGNFEASNVLHYQRRLLNDYFLELEMCFESSWILQQIIKKEWTKSEAYVCKILVYMNKAVDEDPEMFMDISCIKHESMPRVKGLSKYLIRFYNNLRKESNDMNV